MSRLPIESVSRDERFLEYTVTTQLKADKVAAFDSHYATIKREMERRGTWREGLRLLDVGCGLGLYSEYWHGRGFRVTGIDLNLSSLQIAMTRARERHIPARFTACAATGLPFESGSFDVVFAMSLLEHVPDWRTCTDELVRLLAPGGLLWIETTNVISPRQREFRLPIYSWWPAPAKRMAERLARGPFPALANYTPWPAVNWFSFFSLRRVLTQRGLLVSDRFDCMDLTAASTPKRWVRSLALSADIGRRLSYLLVSEVIVLATRPRELLPRAR